MNASCTRLRQLDQLKIANASRERHMVMVMKSLIHVQKIKQHSQHASHERVQLIYTLLASFMCHFDASAWHCSDQPCRTSPEAALAAFEAALTSNGDTTADVLKLLEAHFLPAGR